MPKTGLIIKFQSATSSFRTQLGNPADNIKASAMELRNYRDDFVDGDELLHLSEQQTTAPTERDCWWEAFRYSLYDWNDSQFKRMNRGRFAYAPVCMTHDYFMMVPIRSYKRMTVYPDGRKKKWYPKIDLDEETGEILSVYAYRKGRKCYGEPSVVLAHRELLDILNEPLLVGDHVNRRGLDNRGDEKASVNLARVSRSINGHNAVRGRADGLQTGVEPKGKNRYGQTQYVGKICFRVNKTRVITIRSKRKWLRPEFAAAWYQNYLKRVHKRAAWAHNPKSVNYPVFPPTLESKRAVAVPPAHIVAQTAHQDVRDTF